MGGARSPSDGLGAELLFAIFLLVPHASGEEADFEDLCAAFPDLAGELRALRAGRLAAEDERSAPAPGTAAGRGARERLERVAGRTARYKVEREIARGGMGLVLRVWDDDLARPLAMKVAVDLAAGPPRATGATTGASARLARFVEEALVSAQLDHPGIVPVHELGVDEEGRPFFTMKLVRGRTLQQVFEELHRGEQGWTRTRVLGLLLRVCEAMAYAHDKGVVHRDLKPANVMVGRFGEVYVMDWGVAKVLGRADRRDLRVRGPAETAVVGGGAPSLVTQDGHVLGTPAYMPPEQADGRVAAMGPPSDVYSIGAMLYHLVSGCVPYGREGAALPPQATWRRVQEGPPESLAVLAPDAPAELVAICEKAMARDPAARYPDVSALAEDLSAFLEGRVVRAYRTGAWIEFRKWMGRNRAFAGALGAAVALALAGTAAVALVQVHGRNVAAAERNVARRMAADVLRLSALQDLDEQLARAEDLWPAFPERIEAYERWIDDANALAAGLPDHRAKRDELRALAAPPEPGEEDRADAWRFPEAEGEARWWHAQLTRLIAGLEALIDPDTGLAAPEGFSRAAGASVPRRLAAAVALREGFAPGGVHAARWEEALPAIRAAYPDLRVTPQMGLVPIGADPASGLWEFAHLASGVPPQRGEDGRLVLTEESAIVLVLLPGGEAWLGAQWNDPEGRNYVDEPMRATREVGKAILPAWLVGKHEITQAQWRRLAGHDPSRYHPGMWKALWLASGEESPALLPVGEVLYDDARRWLERSGLTLPYEDLWEYAYRAGTDTPWWSGATRESLRGATNLHDGYAKANGSWERPWCEEWLDDGATFCAPIASYAPNAFGLHDMAGNMWEWCLDHHPAGGGPPWDPATWGEERAVPDEPMCVLRGASFDYDARYARAGWRSIVSSTLALYDVGVRAARPLDP